jgi:uncharacterized protein (DUF1778 family)
MFLRGYKSQMAKKTAKTKQRPTLHVRCDEEDQEIFRRAAKAEGFNSVSSWVLWNLRRTAKQTLNDEREK